MLFFPLRLLTLILKLSGFTVKVFFNAEDVVREFLRLFTGKLTEIVRRISTLDLKSL